MSELENDFHSLQNYEEELQEEPLEQAIQDFYEGQDNLLEACKDYAHLPNTKHRKGLKKTSAQLVDKFWFVASELISDEVTDEKLVALQTFMVNADNHWVGSIQDITYTKRIFYTPSEGQLDSLITIHQATDTVEGFICRVADDFGLNLKADMKAFRKKALEEHAAKRVNNLIVSFSTIADIKDSTNAANSAPTGLLAFAIEPKLADIYTPDFIPNATITFSGKTATYGCVQIDKTPLKGEKPKQAKERLQLELYKNFSQALNPFHELNMQIMGDTWPEK